jgi:hypothetical protein
MREKAYTVDGFINRVRSHPAFQTGAWVRRTDDLEAVLRVLFVFDDECAIEMSDKIRDVIERKHVSVEKRIVLIQQILRAGRNSCVWECSIRRFCKAALKPMSPHRSTGQPVMEFRAWTDDKPPLGLPLPLRTKKAPAFDRGQVRRRLRPREGVSRPKAHNHYVP